MGQEMKSSLPGNLIPVGLECIPEVRLWISKSIAALICFSRPGTWHLPRTNREYYDPP